MRFLRPILLLFFVSLQNLVFSQIANSDEVTTDEDTEVAIDATANDFALLGINKATVDLNPGEDDIQRTFTTTEGTFTVNDAGIVSFVPVADRSGQDAVASYTFKDFLGITSGVGTITVTVTPVNDVPVITGQNLVSMQEDATRALEVSDLLIDDPDDAYPGGFSLTVQNGQNYTVVSGTTVRPNQNFAGTLTVNVTVNDGDAESNTFPLQVTVNGVNDAPVITGQAVLETNEDMPLVLTLENLQVTDPDNTYPTGFTLTVSPSGNNYTVSGTTVIPAANFTGTLSVPVTVNDGAIESTSKVITITVRPANDAPIITGQRAITINEDASRTIILADLTVTDLDNNFPAGFSLTVLDGTNYTVNGAAITPAVNFNGPLTVNVKVNDGTDDSNIFGLQITVRPVNDVPVITGQVTISVGESQPIPLDLTQLTVADPDNSYPTDFSLSILSGANYSVTGNIVTPVANFSGTLPVKVFVNDGALSSAVYNLQIQVNSTNDAPVITGQKTLQTDEEQAITLQLSDLTVSDPDSPFPTGFSLIVLQGTNYGVSGQTVTPATNFTGTLTVSVKVNDGSVDSAPFPLQITVRAVNDAPAITGQQTVSTTEDKALTLEFINLTVSDPDNTYPTGFSMTIGSGNNYTASGRTITPDPNFNGLLTVPVTVSDGALTSVSFNARITVTAVNDAPVINGQNAVTTAEDQAVTILLSHLQVSDVDNTFPTGFGLTVQAGTNYTVAAGNKITPVANFVGTLSVNVTVSDGSLSSASFPLQVTVTEFNDPPVITGQVVLSVEEDQPITLELADLKVTDPDDIYPTGFTMTVANGTNYTVAGLIITPVADFSGTLTVPVRVNDGNSTSAAFNLQIQVTQINDAPRFATIANLEVTENSGQHTLTITGVTKGRNENSQQLTWVVSSDNATIVSIPQPAINYNQSATTATLTYIVQPTRAGVANITVTVVDNGSGTAPNVNTYTQTFSITVSETNDAPTLDPVTVAAIQEDAALQTVPLTGITAGPQETQDLTVSVETNKPALFEILEVVYNSPQTTGTLRLKPKANANGTAQVTITVQDSGLGTPAPNINFIERSVNVTIQSVNDIPVFQTTPVLTASVGEPYEYAVVVTDADGENLALTAPVRPAWLTLVSAGNGKAKLQGTPPAGVGGSTAIQLSVKDGSGTPVLQEFTIVINDRPTVRPFTIQSQEDKVVTFTYEQFANAFTDSDGSNLAEIMITALPKHGTLRLNGAILQGGESILIPASEITNVTYTPVQEYAGLDTLRWNGSDGLNYSRTDTYVDFVMPVVNDAPTIEGLETDSLAYEVGNETPRFITESFTAADVDNDSLASAEVGFRRQNHSPLNDRLLFTGTSAITGVFDSQAGILSLTGKAPLAEYTQVIRSIQYNYVNLTDIRLDVKNIYITLNDGKTFSETKDRLVALIYTFRDLDIPTGFTPNGDLANDYWKITSNKGLEQYKDAEIRIFDRRGQLIYEAVGFERPWDGTYQGQRLPVDSYFYTIDLKYNRVKYKGVVTILR